jgi:hypothetical protein
VEQHGLLHRRELVDELDLVPLLALLRREILDEAHFYRRFSGNSFLSETALSFFIRKNLRTVSVLLVKEMFSTLIATQFIDEYT